jgi:hypothetical protein
MMFLPQKFLLYTAVTMVVIVWHLDFLLPVQSVPITVFEIRLSNLLVQNWQKLRNVVSSTLCLSEIRTHDVSGDTVTDFSSGLLAHTQ